MRNLKKLFLGVAMIGSLAVTQVTFAEVVIIGHPSNSTAELSKSEVKRIFLGKTKQFPNGEKAIPVDQGPGSPTRAHFYKNVVSKTESQLKSYWSRVIFTGKGQPPRQEGGDDAIKNLVSTNPNLVGYVDAGKVDGSVKVLMKVP